MRWQFGGNLQPVRMICEIDWRECPSAILNYVWSEIVTDVVDCLTNEWMMWRVIAMLFVCTLLIHTIYSKTRLINETTTNRDNLNVVGCKVQDLELKVNILTYKMQYGTWPLPRQIRGTGVDAGLRNVRLTLTNSNDRNAWIKHMLLSPSENAACVPYAKIGPRSVRCLTKLINLETKYMSSRFSRDPSPGSNKQKSSHSNSVKSFICAKASSKSLKMEDEKNIPKSENFGLRKQEKNEDSLNPTNNCWSETQVTRYREFARMKNRQTRDTQTGKKVSRKSTKFDKSPEKRVNATNETLNLVKEKLENLHSVLRLCSEAKINENEENKNSNKELAESILQDLKNLGNITTESESEKIVDFLPIILGSNTDDSQCPEEIEQNRQEETMEKEKPNESTSEFEQCQSDDSSWPIVDQGSKIFSESPKMSVEKLEKSVVPRKNSDVIEIDPKISSSRDPKAFPSETGRKSLEIDIAISSPISSFTELSKDSDSDDRSNVTLLREALKFKNALITRIELENDENRQKDRQDSRSEDSESDELSWQKLKSNFKSKQLDIISEEQSAASSSEKRTLKKIETISKSAEKSALDEKPDITELSQDPESSRLALASGSSEYFSLLNLDDEKIGKNRQSDLSMESNDQDGEKIAKNINDLVNDSVQNIRDYIEVFTQMQNNAIVETRRLIDDNDFPRETTSLDSITRFVNTIGITMSEELPRKLSEPAIISLIDLEIIDTDDDSPDTDYKPDFELKRRPGSISIAEEHLDDDKSSDNEIVREKSFYQDILPTGSEVSSINSCDESILDYCHDISDAKSMNPIINDDESRDRDEDRRVDSPMTGRTVIRATGSSTSNFALTNESSEENVDYDCERNYIASPIFEIVEIDDTIDIEKTIGIEKNAEISETNILPETSSIYFTDEACLIENKLSSPEITESESNTWIFENTDLVRPEVVVKEVEKLQDRIEESPEGSESAWIFENFPNGHKPEVANLNVENLMEKSVKKSDETKRGNLAKDETILDKPEVRIAMEKSRRPDSAETVVINSSKIDKKETVSNDNSGTYIDANSREFLNLTNKTSEKSKKSAKSARGSSSSPLQQRIAWSAPKRGSSLNNATEKSRKIDSAIGTTEKSLKIVKSKRATRSQSSGNRKIENLAITGDIEKSKIDGGSIGNDMRDRRSRSYVTPRNFEASTKNSDNSRNFEVSQRPSRTRRDEKLQNSTENVKSLKSLSNEDSTSRSVSKTSSKSCIPILRSRLETVRKNSREKRLKSPARCPLTISTSSWSQENRRIVDESPISSTRIEEIVDTAEKSIFDRETTDKIEEEEKIGNFCEDRSIDRSMENRTVIYVNIVTEQERKSATRVVDPKKFLEYLKDRELKIQSVHDQEIVGKKETSSSENEHSPKILTIVSSAVENEENEENVFKRRDEKSGTWSVRVEHREIQVSTKPSVIDTSTSISDFVDDTKNPIKNGDEKFQIFDVPKELTKDEYIILLEALNQDPNLHQLKEMHKLCNKLGLGFHE